MIGGGFLDLGSFLDYEILGGLCSLDPSVVHVSLYDLGWVGLGSGKSVVLRAHHCTLAKLGLGFLHRAWVLLGFERDRIGTEGYGS